MGLVVSKLVNVFLWRRISEVTSVPSAVVRTVRSSFSLAEMLHLTLQCFDTVGWAAGRASGL